MSEEQRARPDLAAGADAQAPAPAGERQASALEGSKRPALRISQTALESFRRCPRQFYLRYRLGLAWPAAPSAEPAELEAAMARGSRFHDLIERSGRGLDVAGLLASYEDPQLDAWWTAYAESGLEGMAGQRLDEVELSAPLAGQRLIARFDRLLISPDGLVTIFDWKTGARLPSAERLEARWQTQVYRWLLVEAAPNLLGGLKLAPEQVAMTYWHPQTPEAPVTLGYDSASHEAAALGLAQVVDDMRSRTQESEHPKTDVLTSCAHCSFRARCGRGRPAAGWDDQALDSAASPLPPLEAPEDA